MKLSKMALVAAIACGIHAGSVFGQQATYGVQQVACADCDCGQPVCGCEAPLSGCDASSCDAGCDSGCGFGSCLGRLGCCDLGEPWTLFGERCGWSAGGWASVGYHSAANTLFNSRPDEVQLHQAWLYAEKAIDTSGGFDIGGRIDYIYGTDGPDTQAFGTDPRGWDNRWDNGGDYGHAIPQAYFEMGYGDLSVKLGHFYTIIGWEVVQATGNFFYSHAYTMYNSEPFTHTGALATYNLSDDVTIWGGYVLGWDSGFDDNGDAFLGGISAQVTDSLNLIYATTIGRFGEQRFGNDERGYMHSIVADYSVTDKLQYIFQSDFLDTQDSNSAGVRNTFGINQYLIYAINDCWAVGSRAEWYNNEGVYTPFGDETDIYALTAGLNYRPTANVIMRPEIRWDWDRNGAADALENNSSNQFTFGMDTIFTF
jgi:hypothetical protein